MRDPRLAAALFALLAIVIVLPYLAGIAPKSRKHWVWVLVTVVFLFWLLAGFGTVRAIPSQP